MRNYAVKLYHTDKLISDVYGLRYKVYCDERGFEKPEDHPGGIETDEYDQHSAHFAAINPDNNQVVGTARIIFNTSKGFPFEKHAKVYRGVIDRVDRNHLGEISRLAISKEYRRHLAVDARPDLYGYGADCYAAWDEAEKIDVCQDIIASLYRSIYGECRENNLTHLVAVMADSLHRLLKKNGILFEPIGPSVYYHGMRTPYLCCLEKMVDNLKESNPYNYRRILLH